MNVKSTMHKHRIAGLGAAVLFASAAVSCTQLTSLGISSEQIVDVDGAEARPAHYTALTVGAGVTLTPNAHLGDVDGDGLDDLLVGAMALTTKPDSVPDMTVYLFYGRAAFPPVLSPADADASFETGYVEGLTLGDINGDGLADFVLGDGSGYELVFGNRKRFSGHHAKFTSGLLWRYGDSVLEDGDFFIARFYRALAVGDINGDGAAELVFQLGERTGGATGVSLKQYLFEGRKEGWPSGAWDASWAAASFGADEPSQQLLDVWSSGDLDGDGCSDLIASGDGKYWLFYGKRAGLRGTLTASQADAELVTGDSMPAFSGDLDGDGADDLQLYSSGELQIIYGSAQRYAGAVQLQADLTFVDTSGGAQVGDLNADGLPDVLITGKAAQERPDPTSALATTVYQVRGTGARLTGRYELQPQQRYRPVGYAAPPTIDTASFSFFDARSDFDGDGSSDLLVVDLNDVSPDVHGAVYLLPGSSRAPD